MTTMKGWRPDQSGLKDLIFRNEGSIWLMVAVTPAGEDWIAEHISEDAMTWGKAIVVEHRYVDSLVAYAREYGLVV